MTEWLSLRGAQRRSNPLDGGRQTAVGRAFQPLRRGCHCEERSDEAIPLPVRRLLRFARNDSSGCHSEERSDEAIPSTVDGRQP